MIKLDLSPLEHLIAHVPDVAQAACEEPAEDVLGRLKEMEPRVTGALQESLGIYAGVYAGEAFAVIGPQSDRTADDRRETRPVVYQESAEAAHAYFMRTLLGPDDVAALADAAGKAIERELQGAS